ncbi:hypothetical protein CN367_11765 [Priestia megaterium]|uniref:phage head morphogenesis protein n=1 Tax=Priestia megaterium TaxID=1404 RepID=UPI000BF2EB47|nr:minor capsid protein [Priestia megaterium]PEZ47037.1 hypothetical protein CN367_11765 [Priestia megaterium]
MTFGERRKRADIQLVLKDMDLVESAFLTDAQKLNKKRQAQLVKRVEKILGELFDAHQKGDKEEIEGILKSIKMPSSKEWYKLMDGLVVSAVKTGILRAHLEILRLRELYEFSELDIKSEYGYDVIIPEEAREWLKKYGYEIGVITEQTVKDKLIKELEDCLDEGVPPREVTARVKEVCGTWMSDFHAETIARTETAKMYNAGRIARYLDPETDGFVEALQYDAIVDPRTTDLCRGLNGKIIAITNSARIAEMSPPNHFRCRATWLPVTRYEDWKDDFPEDAKPEKGFTFTPPLPKLLQGKKKPLVKPVLEPNETPANITDPFKIRSLNDADFKLAIGNITDPTLKLAMILERASEMVVRETGLKEVVAGTAFMFHGFYDSSTAVFEMFGEDYEFHATPDMKADIEAFLALMVIAQKESNEKAFEEIENFAKKHGDDARFVDIIAKLRTAQKKTKSKATWNGLKPVSDRSSEAKKLLTIKRPAQTANYKTAKGLQLAIATGEEWMLKYVDNKLAPQKGIKVRFQNTLNRAYATGATGEIYFGRIETDPSVVVHESAHVMHWQTKEIIELVNEFFMKRTDHLTKPKSKRHGEPNIPDDFFNSYIGRLYGWEERIAERLGYEGFYGQEVFSMGLQYMMKDPMKFYKDDKEHFLFTYAIMRGLF